MSDPIRIRVCLRLTRLFGAGPKSRLGRVPTPSRHQFILRSLRRSRTREIITEQEMSVPHVPVTGSEPKPPPPPPLPLYSWQDKNLQCRLVYITDPEQANLELSRITCGPLGFDLEWRPTFAKGLPENPVALVQLANADSILLIQISAMSRFPDKLRDVLQNTNIIKAGVGIQNDCRKLYADHGISVRNCVDLSCLARSVDNARWKGKYNQPIGLARLVATYEELELPKGRVQRSNWEQVLNVKQQEYAANDAHSGFIIFTKLIAMAQFVDPVPLSAYYSFDAIEGILLQVDGLGAEWCPNNPNYDPGPPPPPREKKERKPREPGEQNLEATGETASPDATGGDRAPGPSRQRRQRRRGPKPTYPTASTTTAAPGTTTDALPYGFGAPQPQRRPNMSQDKPRGPNRFGSRRDGDRSERAKPS